MAGADDAVANAAEAAASLALKSAVIGGLVAGGLTLLGVLVAHGLAVKSQRDRERQVIQRFLQAVLDEIETVWQRYMDTMGSNVETLRDGQMLNMYYPVFQDYFTVYHTNSFLLTQVEHDDLRNMIVSTYTNAKGLVDSFRFNNLTLEKYENSFLTYQVTQADYYKEKAAQEHVVLVEYAKTLCNQHAALKTQVQNLLRELRRVLK